VGGGVCSYVGLRLGHCLLAVSTELGFHEGIVVRHGSSSSDSRRAQRLVESMLQLVTCHHTRYNSGGILSDIFQ
jgi:hypothetical protein